MTDHDRTTDDDLGYLQPDRRLQTVVAELAAKVHSLELLSATNAIKVAGLDGEIRGIRSTTATSIEVKAASDILTLKLDHVHADLAGIRSIMTWTLAFVATSVIGAVIVAVMNNVLK